MARGCGVPRTKRDVTSYVSTGTRVGASMSFSRDVAGNVSRSDLEGAVRLPGGQSHEVVESPRTKRDVTSYVSTGTRGGVSMSFSRDVAGNVSRSELERAVRLPGEEWHEVVESPRTKET